MGVPENVLVVEDEEEWSSIYVRAAGGRGSPPAIKIAPDLASAKRLIDDIKFAVAFIDIGLDVSDDRNVDGLRVMESIRAVGDETSIVVVTGRSGQDVLQVARDAIKKYGAYDMVGKHTVRPSDIRQLLDGGLDTYRSATVPSRMAARDALSGDASPNIWDDRVTRAIGYKGDIGTFYDFLGRLLGEYLPIAPRSVGDRTILDPEKRLIYGSYWSRAIGAAIAIWVSPADSDGASDLVDISMFHDEAAVAPIRELDGLGIKGGVLTMGRESRTIFGQC